MGPRSNICIEYLNIHSVDLREAETEMEAKECKRCSACLVYEGLFNGAQNKMLSAVYVYTMRFYRKIASCQKYDIQPIDQIMMYGTKTSQALIHTPLHLPFTYHPRGEGKMLK